MAAQHRLAAVGARGDTERAAAEAARWADKNMNSVMAIHPYMREGVWVFDDAAVGLREEPFISGADRIIDRMVVDLSGAEGGFTLLFAGRAFPGYQLELEWVREDMSGNWYRSDALGMEGWLCPALLKYFDSPPARLYAQFRARSHNRAIELATTSMRTR